MYYKFLGSFEKIERLERLVCNMIVLLQSILSGQLDGSEGLWDISSIEIPLGFYYTRYYTLHTRQQNMFFSLFLFRRANISCHTVPQDEGKFENDKKRFYKN